MFDVKEKITRPGIYLTGAPTEHTSPPIRDGVPHIPKLTSHEPPVRTGTSSSFSLTIVSPVGGPHSLRGVVIAAAMRNYPREMSKCPGLRLRHRPFNITPRPQMRCENPAPQCHAWDARPCDSMWM